MIDGVAQGVQNAALLARDLRWLAWAVIALGGSYLIARFIAVSRPRT